MQYCLTPTSDLNGFDLQLLTLMVYMLLSYRLHILLIMCSSTSDTRRISHSLLHLTVLNALEKSTKHMYTLVLSQ